LPHVPFRAAASPPPRRPLTDKNGGYLIERYSIFATYAYRGTRRFKIWTV
jgi:hypothetical protein